MAYDQQFSGGYRFRDAEVAQKALLCCAGVEDSLVAVEDWVVNGTEMSVDVDVSGPASMWEPTLDVIRRVAQRAASGVVTCRFVADLGEAEVEEIPASGCAD